ncbi:exopolysaccharide biosynthesis polyprenyl glycosylphosphotransferase [Telluribacter sp.]|jgi:putative colanic acid biosynthesis UDP-glucose lipid carrier transferase|uniref:exopolysaccharide biosynthesis polyprenyl glycosylphosphotransferase n=1 Tax=Telluribacter sp. TaxID=1978767 RepID=UPI002E1295CC|nr:exopolysaccharide biosynthesis polyprenyl glycosylphosphotransferase [Telluribacter sp.]
MKNRSTGLVSKTHLWTDILLLNASFLIAYLVRFDTLLTDLNPHYINLLLVSNLLWVLVIYFLRTYNFTRLSYTFNDQEGNLIKATLLHAVCLTGVIYLSQLGDAYSRIQLAMTYGLFILSATVVRIAMLLSLQLYRRAGYDFRRYAVVGDDELIEYIKEFYEQRPELGYHYYGLFEFKDHSQDEAALEGFIEHRNLDYVYCCLSKLNDEQVRSIIQVAERQRTQVRLVPDFRGFMTNHATIEYHDVYPVIEVSTKPFSSPQEQTVKRAFDLLFSLLVMLVGAPVFLLVMVAVKLTSPGPVFFTQSRTGRWGKNFSIYKFRTMKVDADSYGLQHSQGKKDPRLTGIGAFLRQTRLDELPQFLNVIKGEMSVVGPRPLPHYDVEMLMKAAPKEFKKILTVNPGITSIGQIKAGYATNEAENVNRLRYDLEYLGKYSLRQDISLVMQTVVVMMLGRGR